MDWKEISPFLNKFRKITPPEGSKKNIIISVFNEQFNHRISKDDISITNTVAFIRMPSAVKTEYILRKESILKKIQSTPEGRSISDIR
tara:strand:+ start:3430 stop:3693 length:264 start_codon:yes stop_codon:yes gene_type:complete